MSIEFTNLKFGELPRDEQLRMFGAWLDGKKIEVYHTHINEWDIIENPRWIWHTEYRVKPKPEPKLKVFSELTKEKQKELLYAHHCGRVESLCQNVGWVIYSKYDTLSNIGVYRIKG
jgi:hypothetical protein